MFVFLQNLMQLPTVSGSIEVWDFLSVDSQVQFPFPHINFVFPNRLFFLDDLLLLCVILQTYIFTNSFSIIETLSGHPCLFDCVVRQRFYFLLLFFDFGIQLWQEHVHKLLCERRVTNFLAGEKQWWHSRGWFWVVYVSGVGCRVSGDGHFCRLFYITLDI